MSQGGTDNEGCSHSEKVKVKVTILGARHKVKQKLFFRSRYSLERNIIGRA